ncbi:MAG TPA: aromatic amino acid ammonia-lyase [Baekduia sp.]|uniref:HAL/PAL/TAL family ammonia-lyase n=1 Tax=Baekduia sp. TaxID=2600305 RepID=UPI002C015085|nr:aromatic amino acid ammonia-lyase [Baekduia sp.]HMJ36742.1 aromatic amino acid ammonia-lyase [Baekduia sp.]
MPGAGIGRSTARRPVPGVVVDGRLGLDALWAIAHGAARVELAPLTLAAVARNRASLEEAVAAGAPVYGLTTAVGALVTEPADVGRTQEAARSLLRSHAAGVGRDLAPELVRAALAARLSTLACAHSGVRPELLLAIAALLNADVVPRVPAGSLGPVGELAPAAHAYLPLIGEGEVRDARGRVVRGAAGLRSVGLAPLPLDGREALALLSGTSFPAAIAALAAVRVRHVLAAADVAAAVAFDVLDGALPALDARVHALHHLPGQARSAQHLRTMLAGRDRPAHAAAPLRLQDPYSLRCAPQIHGAARTAGSFFATIVEGELTSVTDNPLVFDDPAEVLSSGNFHAQALAMACDTMRAALADLGSVSERRTYRLVSPSTNGALPPFLTEHPGASGYMILQYTAAGLVSELRLLAHPVACDSVVVSDNQEDHASNAMLAANTLMESLDRIETIVAAELVCGCQAVDLRARRDGGHAGHGTLAAHAAVRTVVAPLDCDRPPAGDVAAVAELVAAGTFTALLDELLAAAPEPTRGP